MLQCLPDGLGYKQILTLTEHLRNKPFDTFFLYGKYSELSRALGFFRVQPFLKFLPSRDQLDSESIHCSQKVSLLRRFTVMMPDLFLPLSERWASYFQIR